MSRDVLSVLLASILWFLSGLSAKAETVGAAGAVHYGGGLNYWVGRRIGLRFEFRHHLWSPEGGETVHLIGFRIGVAFR
jgi:hypothetical protein